MAGIVDDLRRIPMSQGLAATLARAADYAQAQSHPHVLLEHLLLALTEDEDAVQVLSASHVELSLLKADVSQYLGGLSERSQASPGTPMAVSPDLKRILEAAAAAASQGRRRDINGAIVLAAIVGDGRSAAAGMLRAQGLTFEEAIKALQRALAPAPARPVPPPEPDAEDILATARQRVQTRATPGLPPAPVVVPPEPQPAPPAVQAPPVAAAVWPPEVRTSTEQPVAEPASPADDFRDAFERELPPARHDPHSDGQGFAGDESPAEAPFEGHGAVPDLAPQPFYPPQTPAPPARMPSQARPVAPQPGSRWPAPVAPAWQAPADQHPGHSEPEAAAQAYGPYEPPDEPPSWPGYPQPAQIPGPPPLPQQTVAPPPLPPPPHWADGAGPGGAVQSAPWPETEVQGHDYGPAPEAWPPAPQPRTYGPANSGAPWPDTHWPPPAPQLVPETMATQPAPAPEVPAPPALGREVPQAADGPTTGGRPGRKRKSAERAVAGQMVENIPRRMRAHVPIDVDVRIAKSEFRALADGLAGAGEPHTHGVQVTPAMSVRLRAPDGGFIIDSAAPETQWLESRLGQLETDFASWRWTVTPLKSGRRRLQLVVSARTSSSGGTAGDTPLPEQVIDIAVATNWGRATARAMTWALFALAGGLIAKFGSALYDPLIAAVLKAIK